MTRILITGAGGQIGWALSRQASDAVALDRASLDITDAARVEEVFGRYAPDVVINAAAYTAVDKAESEPAAAHDVNALGPRILAEACARYDAALLHISTDYVFDGRSRKAYREADPECPLGVYGKSKLAGERAVRETLERHLILRTSWVFGIHGNNFVKTMVRVGADRGTLRVVDDQVGQPTFAGDIAMTLLDLAGRLASRSQGDVGFGIFHFAGSGPVTWYGFARAIFEESARRGGPAVTVEPITTAEYPTAAKRPANSTLNSDKLALVHGITPRSWRDGLCEMLDAK